MPLPELLEFPFVENLRIDEPFDGFAHEAFRTLETLCCTRQGRFNQPAHFNVYLASSRLAVFLFAQERAASEKGLRDRKSTR